MAASVCQRALGSNRECISDRKVYFWLSLKNARNCALGQLFAIFVVGEVEETRTLLR
jgi:hypothetical protein